MIHKIPTESTKNVAVIRDVDSGDKEIDEMWRVFGDEFSV